MAKKKTSGGPDDDDPTRRPDKSSPRTFYEYAFFLAIFGQIRPFERIHKNKWARISTNSKNDQNLLLKYDAQKDHLLHQIIEGLFQAPNY